MFSDQSAELSLNIPCRSITSIPADRVHHRFLVGTSASAGSSSYHNHDDDDDNNNCSDEINSCPNSIYLLRFHEELNELGVDGILEHPTGEIWSMSSCPYDKALVLTCGGGGGIGGGGGAKTKLWRFPHVIIDNEDELEYLPDGGDNHGGGLKQGGVNSDGLERGVGSDGVTGRMRKSRAKMEEMTELKTCQDGMTTTAGSNLFQGRLSSILWNPLSSSSSSSIGYFDPEDDEVGHVDDDMDSSAKGDILTLDYAGNIFRWDVSTSDAKETQHFSLSPTSSSSKAATLLSLPPRMAWDPHDTNHIAVSQHTTVTLYDLRTSAISASLPTNCHRYGITDLDYNPNKTHTLVTSGRDGLIKFWDLRFLGGGENFDGERRNHKKNKRIKPVKIIQGGHTHWSTTVKYNTFHDQLMLSGGTDSVVNLWRISSVSSAPLLDLGDDDDDDDNSVVEEEDDDVFGKKKDDGGGDSYFQNFTGQSLDDEDFGRNGNYNTKSPSKQNSQNAKGVRTEKTAGGPGADDSSSAPDVRVSSHIHTDAVYDVTWSAVDAWVFASLSYDGNVILNHVPSKEKYKILL